MGENQNMSDDRASASIEVGLLLNQVHALATQRLNTALRPMELTSRHVAVMFLIRDGVQTQRDLVVRLNTDKTGMVRMIDDLERLGHVSRTPSDRDRRVTILDLTSHGAQALRSAQHHTQAVADELFHAVGDDDLESLRSILTRTLSERPTE
ncbi:MarR family winged helix-turn-helix transcriptional regulator [Agromyces sp. Marseille-Q5079]|uniref:MarR family winged helix-turn-helix transcriptional regulator n=1 Tax=Agromyces sp. Marseille-Q5079 TaxID=3439059 RepID=UPI003D9CB5E2